MHPPFCSCTSSVSSNHKPLNAVWIQRLWVRREKHCPKSSETGSHTLQKNLTWRCIKKISTAHAFSRSCHRQDANTGSMSPCELPRELHSSHFNLVDSKDLISYGFDLQWRVVGKAPICNWWSTDCLSDADSWSWFQLICNSIFIDRPYNEDVIMWSQVIPARFTMIIKTMMIAAHKKAAYAVMSQQSILAELMDVSSDDEGC